MYSGLYLDANGGLGVEITVQDDSVTKEDLTIVSCQVLPGEDSEVYYYCMAASCFHHYGFYI